jgi:ABC-type multidrug transport system ATPase subunit
VAGLVLPDSGRIDILCRGPFDAAVHGGRISILPQDSEPPLEAGARELLVSYARLQGMPSAAAGRSADRLLSAFNLEAHASKRIGSLSHGMRKRVMAAQAFLGDPEIVLLDEPLSGLDPCEANRMREFIKARRGRQTMVISSHDLGDIEKLCTHVAFIAGGRVEKTDTVAGITSRSGRIVYRLRRAPGDFGLLERKIENLRLSWSEETRELAAVFPPGVPQEDVNGALLPELLGCGVVSVAAGRTLEELYLGI